MLLAPDRAMKYLSLGFQGQHFPFADVEYRVACLNCIRSLAAFTSAPLDILLVPQVHDAQLALLAMIACGEFRQVLRLEHIADYFELCHLT